MKEILLNYGFTNDELHNSFKYGKRHKATIWKSGGVSISYYTPTFGRHLTTTFYNTVEELKNYLDKNCFFK